MREDFGFESGFFTRSSFVNAGKESCSNFFEMLFMSVQFLLDETIGSFIASKFNFNQFLSGFSLGKGFEVFPEEVLSESGKIRISEQSLQCKFYPQLMILP